MTNGYQALREGAAVIDLDARGRIRVTGGDRIRLLHAMCTNNVEALEPGQSCYAFFLNAQGRILADLNVLCYPGHLLLETEPETREKIYQHLDRYIIADDVTLEDVTEVIGSVGLEGPRAEEILEKLGAPTPDAPGSFIEGDIGAVARLDLAGAGGFRIFAPSGVLPAIRDRLLHAGAASATADDLRTVRIANARPRYGEDLTEDYIPHETQLLSAVSFEKGCYLGQEIVERVRSRGNVNKLLVPLRLDGEQPPTAGTKLKTGDREVGVITSAVYSPADGKVAALGYVRAAHAKAGEKLDVQGTVAEVTAVSPT